MSKDHVVFLYQSEELSFRGSIEKIKYPYEVDSMYESSISIFEIVLLFNVHKTKQ